MTNLWKILFTALGGIAGWFIAEFRPTFPLIAVAVLFIVTDAYTAFRLDQRVHRAYPDRATRNKAKFTSFAFGKVVRQTIPKRMWLIFLAYVLEHWVFTFVDIKLSYIVTGIICFEQAWSFLENESSCRTEAEGKFWRVLQHIMIDKTSRHFDVDLSELENSSTTTTTPTVSDHTDHIDHIDHNDHNG